MDNSFIGFLQIALRITGAIVCYKQAKWLNRDVGGWLIAGLIFPIIAMIWVYNKKHIPKKNIISDPKPFSTYYTENGVITVEREGEKRVTINDKPSPNGKYQLNHLESIEVFDGKVLSTLN